MEIENKYLKGKYARSHYEARKVICCCCGKKVKCVKKSDSAFIVNERFSNLVRKFVLPEFSEHNESHPIALCDSCRLTLAAHEKVQLLFSIV